MRLYKPVLICLISTLPITVSFSATNNLSGVAWTTSNITITEDGIHQIEYHSTDNAGNVEEIKTITVKLDTTPPEVSISASPATLWPPNHKLVDITVSGSASDNLSGIEFISFQVIDEYGECEPVISNFGDVIKLISWRKGNDLNGREYAIQVKAFDVAGNLEIKEIIVLVPHDQRDKVDNSNTHFKRGPP